MRKKLTALVICLVAMISTGCSATTNPGSVSNTANGSSSVSSAVSESSVVSSLLAPVSEEESSSSSSYSFDDERVSFPSDYKKYESYVRNRSDWTYVDTDYLARYARLPEPSCIFGCKYGYGDEKGVAYTMDDYDCILAYFFLIKSQEFEYEEVGSTSKATLYNIFDDDGNFIAGCMMSEVSSGPVLLITSSD